VKSGLDAQLQFMLRIKPNFNPNTAADARAPSTSKPEKWEPKPVDWELRHARVFWDGSVFGDVDRPTAVK
jgi:hypothetical protein